MSQITINIGSLPNDGLGDPIRTAFNDTNKNFANVFAAGPVGSNLVIQNNSIISTNTNGEIRLVPNGVGNVTSNAHILPNATNIRNLGSSNRRWRSLYAQYADIQNQNVWGNLVVAGNLNVTGNVVTANVATLDVANLTITLAAGATSPGVADGAGILVDGANANITYSAASNTFDFNIGLGVDGTVQALYYIGDGGGLSNLNVAVNSANITGSNLSNSVQYSNLTTVGTLANLLVSGNIQTAGVFIGNGAGLTSIPGNAITGTAANAQYANVAALALNANVAAQAVYATTSNYALTAGKADYANRANIAANAVYANTAYMACLADVANAAIIASNAIYSNSSVYAGIVTGNAQPNITSVGTLSNLAVSGNIVTTAGIYTDNYFYANGAPFSGSGNGGGTNYGNSNVAAFLPTYSGNLGAISVTGISSNNYLWANGQPFTGTYNDANVIALMASGNVPFIDTANINTTSLTVTGYSSLTRLGVTGNANIGNIFSDHFYYANGTPIVFGGSGGSGGVIGDQQITPDGITATYALTLASTNDAVVVSINGLTQAPGVAYTVTGNSITFAGVPAVSDYIDIRFFGTGNGNSSGSYGDSNVISLLSSGSIGNTIPSGNAVHSLGNATNQWKSLYVSGNTIYLNNIPLSVTTSGSKLNWNGDNVVTANPSGNIVTAGNVTGNYFFGNARFMSGLPTQYTDANVAVYLASGVDTANIITQGNVRGSYVLGNGAFLTGMYANSNVASYLPTYTGNLASLGGNIVTSANITGTYVFGNARFMTGLQASYSNANVQTFLPTYDGNLVSLTGNVQTTANVNATYFNGNGRFLTGIISTYGNSNVAAYLPSYTGNLTPTNITATGNITTTTGTINAANLIGINVNATSVTGATVTGINIVAGANVDAAFYNGNGRFLTGVISSYQDANVRAYLASGTANANIITTANISGNYFIGNGSLLTGMNTYSNANVAGFLPIYSGNLSANNVNVTSTLTAEIVRGGNLTVSGNSIGSSSGLTVLTSDVIIAGNLEIQGNSTIIDSNVVSINDKVFVLANNSSTGSAANGAGIQIADANFASINYSNTSNTWNFSLPIVANATYLTNITGANVTGVVANANSALFANLATFANVVTNNAQPNITSVGTLVNLTSSGNITTTANVSANVFLGNGSQLTGMYANANVQAYLPTYTGNLNPDLVFIGNTIPSFVPATTGLVVNSGATPTVHIGNYDPANVAAHGYLQLVAQPGSNGAQIVTDSTFLNITNAGNGGVINISTGLSGSETWVYDSTGNVTWPDGSVQQTAYTGFGNANVVTLLGNLTSNVTTTANVQAANFIGDGSQLANITAANITGVVANANSAVFANLATFANTVTNNAQPNITSVGNLTGLTINGNLNGNGNVIATYFIGDGSNITNLPPGNYSNTNVSAYLSSGNANANIITTANISGNYIIGNGAFLTGLAATYSNANVSVYLASGNANANIITTANISGNALLGNSATVVGNISGNNLSITANIATGNILTDNYLYANGLPVPFGGGGILGDQQFAGTGSTTYPLHQITTSNTVIVTVNGLTQTPGVAYNVAGNVITFSSALGLGDYVDVRFVANSTITGSSVYNDANVAAYLPTYTGAMTSMTGNVTTTGNITGNYLFGNGVFLSGLVNNYSNANVANYLPTYTGNIGGILTTGGQPGITSLGSLVNLTVTGLLLANTIQTIGNISVGTNLNTINVVATGTVTAPNLTSKKTSQVANGTTVTLNNLVASVPAAGNKSLQVRTVNGAGITLVGSEQGVNAGAAVTAAIAPGVIAGTLTYLRAAANYTTAGAVQICNVIDTTAGVGYRLTLVIGSGALNQITIEQLY